VRTVTAATYAEFGPRGLGAPPATTVMKTGGGSATEFDVEDLSTAFLRLSGGATLLLEASWAQWVPEDLCYVTVYGADGGAGITWIPGTERRTIEVWTEDDGRPRRQQPEIPPDGEHLETVVDFLELVRSGQPVHGRHVLTRSAVVDACYASAEAGQEVALPVAALA
jgi:predicted dehydrogenase